MKRTSSLALLIAIILPLIVLMAILIVPVTIEAPTQTNTTEIQVNISEVSQLAITPKSLGWSGLTPGDNGTVQNITVENTGSTTYTNGIFISVDSFVNNTNNPTANDDATKYMAGTFLTVANSSYQTNDEFFFMNQISWNESTHPSGITGEGYATSWGYYHNNSNKWLWELNKSIDGTCQNGSDSGQGAYLRIASTVGSTDLSAGNDINATFIGNKSGWGLWDFATGALAEYCVAAHTSCNYLMIYKFDLNSSLPDNCVNESYMFPETISPSESKVFYVSPHIPTGVPAGTVTNSTVTVTAN